MIHKRTILRLAFLALCIGAIALGIAGCMGDEEPVDENGSPTPPPGAQEVSIGDNFFDPRDLTINVGDTVTWTNNGSNPHTTTSDTGVWNSDSEFPLPLAMQPGDQFSFTFTQAGTFPYFCEIHGAAGGIGQSGTTTVE